ncbi:MAG: NAD(P)-dependent oxidoreductase [Spirochaetaceae bacterium]
MEKEFKRIYIPQSFNNIKELDDFISTPDNELISFIDNLDGDIMILGIGGKVGSHVGFLARNAIIQGENHKKVYGVSRFSDKGIQLELESYGIETIKCDLLDQEGVSRLPKVKNVIFMAGKKFGTESGQGLTWAMNTVVPANVASHFKESRIVVFSTGCVYDLCSINSGGAVEEDPINPMGEYANSAVGRERIFEYYSHKKQTELCMFRLNYAIDMRYGVLHEIALKVLNEESIDLSMGHVNVIWQGDVARMALLSLQQSTYPANILNITGPETISIKYIANQFGKEFNITPIFTGNESDTALLNNASKAASVFGYPRIPLLTMIRWSALWIQNNGATLNKATHFETRDGKY